MLVGWLLFVLVRFVMFSDLSAHFVESLSLGVLTFTFIYFFLSN